MDVFGDRSLSGGWVNKPVRLTRGFSLLAGLAAFFCLLAPTCGAMSATPTVLRCILGIGYSGDSPETHQESYIWPVEGRYALTSTFAEYRSGHFHAGLDISTGGRTGLPVRAADAGHVARVRVSPFGYGKAIYIRQHDGRYAVYAHLKELTPEINTLVKKEQRAAGQYEVEIYPPEGEYPVEQGEVVGFSGRSGCPAPHLHFELRDSSNRPINPLTHGVDVSDPSAPRFVSVCIYPLGGESRVNGEQQPCIVNLGPAGEHNAYRAEKRVRVHGKFALSAHVYDEQDPDSYRVGPWRLETFLGDERVFIASMERFSYERTHDVDAAFDYRLVELGLGKFLRQFAFAGNQLEIHAYQGREAGIMDASGWDRSCGNAAHTIRLVATDAAGNRSEATLEVFRDDEPVVREVRTFLQGDVLRIEAAADDPDGTVTRLHFRVWEEEGGVIAKTYSTPAETGEFAARVELPGSAPASDLVVEAVAEDDGGVMSRPKFVPANATTDNPPARLNLRGEWYENSLFLTIESDRFLKSPPSISSIWDNSSPVPIRAVMQTPRSALCVYTPEMGAGGTLTVSASARDLRGRPAEATWSTKVSTVWHTTGGTVKHGGRLAVDFPPNSVYRPIFGRIEPILEDVRAEIPLVTEAYKIQPVHEPLDGKVTLTFSLEDEEPLRGAGIYMQTRKEDWDYLTTHVDEEQRLLTASISKLGTYAVLRDTIAPRISAIRPRRGATAGTSTPTISAHVEDTGSGIDYKAIKVHLDGKLIICEYDAFENSISYQVEDPLAEGEHTVSISLRDYAGNTSRAESRFTVP